MNYLFAIIFAAFCISGCHSHAVKRSRNFNCGTATVYTQDDGEITSHGGFSTGYHYGKNMHCTWTIEAPAGKIVELVAESFDIEDSSPCSFDYLELYDGNSTRATSIGKFCGNSFNPITSSGRFITLEFISDDNAQLGGFKLFYNFTNTPVLACHGRQLVCANGNCVPQSYRCDRDDDCGDATDEKNCPTVTTGGCRAGEFVCSNKQCVPRDWVCDGDNDCGDGSDELLTNCAGGISPLPGISQTSSAACGTLNFTGTSGSIQSPGYPNSYPDDLFCRYQITAPAGTKNLAFKFADRFSIEQAMNCQTDYVSIYSDGHSFSHGPFCGTTSPGQFTLPKDHATIEFSTDLSDTYPGFKLDWKVVA